LDTEKVQPSAAIRLSHSASDTFSTFEVGNDGYRIPLFKPVGVFSYFSYLTGDLVTKDSRIGEIGLFSFKGMEVRSTDPDTPDTNQGLSWFYLGKVHLFHLQLPRFFTDNGFHRISFLMQT
jgi:hypothetical protein